MKGFYETESPVSPVGFISKATDIGCELHFHSRLELSYILTGTHRISVNNKEYVLTENDILFCNPFDLHQFSNKNDGDHVLISIRNHALQNCFQDKKMPYMPNLLSDKEYNKSILAILNIVLSEKNGITEIEKQGYSDLILGKILKHYPPPVVNEKNRDLYTFIEAITYINQHYTENLTRDSLAKTFNYSPNYFSHQFKKIFNIGIAEYINSIRFSKAYRDISEKRHPNLSNSEIILSHGFNNTQTYYRIYRQQKNSF